MKENANKKKGEFKEFNVIFTKKQLRDYLIPLISDDINYTINTDNITINSSHNIYTIGVINDNNYYWALKVNNKLYLIVNLKNGIEIILNVINDIENRENNIYPDKYISFLDLLNLMQNNIFPNLVELTLVDKHALYKYDGEQDYYLVNKEDESQNFQLFLGDSISDIGKLRKNIRIVK